MVKKFRKKPVVIEAIQFTGDNFSEINDFASEHVAGQSPSEKWMLIYTEEGIMKASAGDWIIKGVKGEVYPRKPDIFEMTYEEE